MKTSGSSTTGAVERADRDRQFIRLRRAKVEALMRGQTAMSTAALLDLLGLPATTANGRVLAKTMRSLGFIPLKSRRLMPGGHLGTVIRGWSRPVIAHDASEGAKVLPSHGYTKPAANAA